jgi:hypothetical protein
MLREAWAALFVAGPRGAWRRLARACVCCGRKDERSTWSWRCGLCKYWGPSECPNGNKCRG